MTKEEEQMLDEALTDLCGFRITTTTTVATDKSVTREDEADPHLGDLHKHQWRIP
jgi:hypothetical protein